MRPLSARHQKARQRLGLPWEALERDYLLSRALTGISQAPVLRDTLVFKGGTALRKRYFGDYRFSEDLDFSALAGVPTGDEMEQWLGPLAPDSLTFETVISELRPQVAQLVRLGGA